MEGKFAEELYSESLEISRIKLDPISDGCDKDGLCGRDESVWDEWYEEEQTTPDMDREWQRRHDQFHTIGYRDGLGAGKEASAQEGFNIGFKQSVLVGYNWGLVRGVTSAFASLPNELKETLVGAKERGNGFQELHESVHSLSTTQALKLFNDDLMAKKASGQSDSNEASSLSAILQEQTSDCCRLVDYFGKLQMLVDSSSIDVHLTDKN